MSKVLEKVAVSHRTPFENFKCLASLCILLLLSAVPCHASNILGHPKAATTQDISSEGRNRDDNTQIFTDERLGYSIHYPRTWKRAATASAPGPAVRLFLVTPHRNRFIVSIYPLPAPLERYSKPTLEQIGHDHVDTILSGYMGKLRFKKILRHQAEDHSDDRAMIFWQGTSALDDNMKGWAMVSTHVIRYGSNFIVNMVFLGETEVEKDGKSMDEVMGSISFGKR